MAKPKSPPSQSPDAERNLQLARIADDLETLIEQYEETNHILKKIAHCVCKPAIKAQSSTLTLKAD